MDRGKERNEEADVSNKLWILHEWTSEINISVGKFQSLSIDLDNLTFIVFDNMFTR